MKQWGQNGGRLGCSIPDNPIETTYSYRPGQPVETVLGFDHEPSGEPVLPGFRLDLRALREATS